MNNYSRLIENIKHDKDFIDLTNTNFTTLRPQISKPEIINEISQYFDKRSYDPHPKGLYSARDAISNYYLSQRNIQIAADNIIITASTSESYSLIFTSLLKAEDTILLPRPAYPLFEYLAQYAHLKILFYDLKVIANKWVIDINDLARKSLKSKAMVIISPNNPTGMIIDQKSFNKILQIAADSNQLMIVDEVFSSYVYSGSNITIPTNKGTILLLNGISKMLAAPDLKLAWIAITGNVNTALIDKLETCNDTYLNCSYLSQTMLPKLMEIGHRLQPQWLSTLISNRKQLDLLFKKNPNIKGVNAQGGIHCVLDFPSLTYKNEDIALKLLNEYKLAVHPGYFYDIAPDRPCVIISLLNSREKFALGISRLQDFSIKYS